MSVSRVYVLSSFCFENNLPMMNATCQSKANGCTTIVRSRNSPAIAHPTEGEESFVIFWVVLLSVFSMEADTDSVMVFVLVMITVDRDKDVVMMHLLFSTEQLCLHTFLLHQTLW